MAQTPGDPDLLVKFERDNIKDDYRVFYAIKRNNLFSSIQGFPELWEFFCRLDEIWRREIGDLEVATDPDRMFPVILYMNAHAKMRISMELAFSNCMPEARSILRDAVENVAHAHHMLRDPANQLIWMKKDEPSGKKAFKTVFEESKKTGLFSGLSELHEMFGELSEAGSHPTLQSFANRVTMEDRNGQRHMIVNYSGAPDRRLFAMELFSRLLTCFVMERTFFDDYETRFNLDARLVQMRHDFEVFKETLRRTLIARYKVQPPPAKPAKP
jgi:hypothetical protein